MIGMHAVNANRTRLTAVVTAAIAFWCVTASVHGATLGIRPIDFGNGQMALGTITVADDTGDIVDWNLEVATVERLARFTPTNTPVKSVTDVSISADGARMTVATSPDSVQDGGILGFRARNPSLDVGTWVANFSGPAIDGGQALFMRGGIFEYLDLHQPPGTESLVARAGVGHAYELVPVRFFNGITMSGAIVTDGRTGALDAPGIVDWDIAVDMVTVTDVFTPSNSRLSASFASLSPDGTMLTVNNPDGSLAFVKAPLGGRLHALQLADFTSELPSGGQAAYYRGRLAIDIVELGAPAGPWAVTGPDRVERVPEPAAFGLVAFGLALLARARRGSRR